jgi:hypothetical protein
MPPKTSQARTVAPDKVRSLRDWVARWPKAVNLGFDAETREPTIYSVDEGHSKVASIPWKREGDMITILSQPSKFSGGAVDAARARSVRIMEQREALSLAKTEELQSLEAELLRSWREYEASPVASRSAMMFDIRAREAAYRVAEEELAAQVQVGRSKVDRGKFTGVVVPSVPIEKRAISLSAAAGAEATASEESSTVSE